MIKEAIAALADGRDLDDKTAEGAMNDIMTGNATAAQTGAFLMGLRTKGETSGEICACAKAMRVNCQAINPPFDVLDIVGTGGDLKYTFNISTVASFVIAGAGVKVAKHGNRSVSSLSGSADVLEAMGVCVALSAQQTQNVLQRTGMCFLYAQSHHPGMKYAAPVRKELGIRTVFNILGPLTNPAGAKFQVLGVYDARLIRPIAEALCGLGLRRAVVVHGEDGLDEVTVCAKTKYATVDSGKICEGEFDPRELGLEFFDGGELTGGDPAANAAVGLDILSGKLTGAKREVVLVNAAFGIYAAGGESTLAGAYRKAKESVDSGAALEKLFELRRAAEAAVNE